jgi:hypothetical protein
MEKLNAENVNFFKILMECKSRKGNKEWKYYF